MLRLSKGTSASIENVHQNTILTMYNVYGTTIQTLCVHKQATNVMSQEAALEHDRCATSSTTA